MKAIALREFASVQLGNVSEGQVIELAQGQFNGMSAVGLVGEYPRVQQVAALAPVVVAPVPDEKAVEVPVPELTDERSELIAKAEALGIHIDARWSTKRLKKVVLG